MDPLTIGLITGGASLLGSIFSSSTSASNTNANIQAQQQAQLATQQFNAEEAAKSREFNSDEAAKARQFSSDQAGINRTFQSDSVHELEDFQRAQSDLAFQRSNTAYQRSRADMVAAGLNPILAATAGGAGTPSPMAGASASGSMPGSPSASGGAASAGTPNMALHNVKSPFADLGENVSRVVNSAISVKTFDKLTQEIANLQAQQAKTSAETETEKTRPDLIHAESAVKGKEFERLHELMPSFTQTGRTAKSLENIPDWLRNSIDIGSYSGSKVSDAIAPLLSTARTARSFSDRFYY